MLPSTCSDHLNWPTLEWKLTNGISESNKAATDRIRSAARGFHDPESFITMIMLDRAGIAPQLPWATASLPTRLQKTLTYAQPLFSSVSKARRLLC